MRKLIICLLTAFALSVTSAYAGPGHSHGPVTPITEKQALENATGIVNSIVQKGKIEASWAEVKPTEAKKKKFKHSQEWVITFSNPKVTDQEKKTLYVFLSLDGHYLAANFSGS